MFLAPHDTLPTVAPFPTASMLRRPLRREARVQPTCETPRGTPPPDPYEESRAAAARPARPANRDRPGPYFSMRNARGGNSWSCATKTARLSATAPPPLLRGGTYEAASPRYRIRLRRSALRRTRCAARVPPAGR